VAAKPSVETARAAQGAADRAAVLDRLRNKRPIRGEYRIQLSDDPVVAVREARNQLEQRENALLSANEATLQIAQERVQDAQERLAKAIAEADADSVLLVFEGLPRDAFHALLDEHQPGDGDKGKDYNPKTFPPALIAATCVDPGFDSAEQVAELIEAWNVTEREALFSVAMSSCLATRVADWGKGFAATRI
jgi:hypothetical protein